MTDWIIVNNTNECTLETSQTLETSEVSEPTLETSQTLQTSETSQTLETSETSEALKASEARVKLLEKQLQEITSTAQQLDAKLRDKCVIIQALEQEIGELKHNNSTVADYKDISMRPTRRVQKTSDSQARKALKETIDANLNQDVGFHKFTQLKAQKRRQEIHQVFERTVQQYYNKVGYCCDQAKEYLCSGSAMCRFQPRKCSPCEHAITEAHRAQNLLYPNWSKQSLKEEWGKMSVDAKLPYYQH